MKRSDFESVCKKTLGISGDEFIAKHCRKEEGVKSDDGTRIYVSKGIIDLCRDIEQFKKAHGLRTKKGKHGRKARTQSESEAAGTGDSTMGAISPRIIWCGLTNSKEPPAAMVAVSKSRKPRISSRKGQRDER